MQKKRGLLHLQNGAGYAMQKTTPVIRNKSYYCLLLLGIVTDNVRADSGLYATSAVSYPQNVIAYITLWRFAYAQNFMHKLADSMQNDTLKNAKNSPWPADIVGKTFYFAVYRPFMPSRVYL